MVKSTLRITTFGAVMIFSLVIGGCGGGSADVASSGLIGGTPKTLAIEGQVYTFQPTIVDPAGAPLSFSIDNRPVWASFDTDTGELTGTPDLGDVGTTSNILISATDGTLSDSIGPFSITVNQAGTGSSVTLSWTPPTLNADGNTLTDLGGYRIRYGTVDGVYPNIVSVDASMTTHVINDLLPDTYFFVATAHDKVGNESQFSNVAMVSVNN